jgi:2-aminoadipate transaminase
MGNVKKSFIREILKVTVNPEVISFAGGLPNPASFPVEEISEAARDVLREDGGNALQYSTTEGYLPLRRKIAERYDKRFGLKVNAEEIMITTGSQQALDLIGKAFLNKGDPVLMERPGYLGAIQAMSIFEPDFQTVSLKEDGVDLTSLNSVLTEHAPKIFYTVPNFQNPSGLTYSGENRKGVAELVRKHSTVLIEDDPYGELRFIGRDIPPIKTYLGDQSVLLGSFSKIVSPGMRLGWVCACPEIMEKLIVCKQASDLHTSYFTQRVVDRYLADHDLDEHIRKIKVMYQTQRNSMVEAVKRYFPSEVRYTEPEGGMFLWATLPEGMSSVELFQLASKSNVAFVPGDPFYVDATNTNTLRLNYTNSNESEIEEGIKRLGSVIRELMAKS